MFDCFPLKSKIGHLRGTRTDFDELHKFFDGRSFPFDFNLHASIIQIFCESGQSETIGVAVNEVPESDSLNKPFDHHISTGFRRLINENTSSWSKMQRNAPYRSDFLKEDKDDNISSAVCGLLAVTRAVRTIAHRRAPDDTPIRSAPRIWEYSCLSNFCVSNTTTLTISRSRRLRPRREMMPPYAPPRMIEGTVACSNARFASNRLVAFP